MCVLVYPFVGNFENWEKFSETSTMQFLCTCYCDRVKILLFVKKRMSLMAQTFKSYMDFFITKSNRISWCANSYEKFPYFIPSQRTICVMEVTIAVTLTLLLRVDILISLCFNFSCQLYSTSCIYTFFSLQLRLKLFCLSLTILKLTSGFSSVYIYIKTR